MRRILCLTPLLATAAAFAEAFQRPIPQPQTSEAELAYLAASLIWSWVGWPVLTPVQSVLGGAILGIPAKWGFARHIRRLMEVADG